MICIDVETKDPNLKKMGPGAIRGDGYICGLAVGTEDRQWYFPMRHERGNNIAPEAVMKWARDAFKDPKQDKLFTNADYDLQWLAREGVRVAGKYLDVQKAEPLIDENQRSYALELLGLKYIGEGKDDEELYEYLAAKFGGKPNRDQAKNIWRAPGDLVAPYAKSDVRLPFLVFDHQQRILESEGLDKVFDIETRLIPLMLAMRERGVRVDVDAASRFDEDLAKDAEEGLKRLDGEGVVFSQPVSIQAYCDRNKISYPLTPTGAASFQKKWLEDHKDVILNEVTKQRGIAKHSGTFLNGIFKHAIDGRIHTQFNQLKGDEYGTVSGRFSSSNPNLQNIPIRNPLLGPRTRALFLPEDGEQWVSDDWSQIEYRFLVHFSAKYGGGKIIQRYNDNPSTDLHDYVANLADINRSDAKNINFGLVYGMGEQTMSVNMGRPLHEVAPIFKKYHAELPFVKQTFNAIMRSAQTRGRITTILGRRRRFETWEPKDYEKAKDVDALGRDEAVEKWGVVNIKRAKCHTAANALFQGSAADAMKKSMVEIWEAGICDVLGAPLLTVHDELNWSVPRTPEAEQAHMEAVQIMTDCVTLRIPLKVDSGSGANWSEAH